jgi:dipeptidyl aminopeptidase/acylaminoacyl peptidase
MRQALWPAAVLLAAASAAAAPPFTATEMMKLQRLGDPQLSPDGSLVVYVATAVTLGANSQNSDLWLVPTAGGVPRRLTNHPLADNRPRWSPDGTRIGFLSRRGGSPQVYAVGTSGDEARPLTSVETGVSSFVWIDDEHLLVTSEVFPECAERKPPAAAVVCNKQKAEAAGKPSSARAYDHLLYRHWDTWEDGKRSHLLVVPTDGSDARDLTPGERDVPPFDVSGPDGFAVSPDGREVAFVRNDDPVEAISTNADIFVVPTAGGNARKIASGPGYDGAPRYSPDGTLLAYRSQPRAGYEADRWRLMVYDRKSGATRELTEGFDLQVESIAWSPDSKTLYFTAAQDARDPLFAVQAAGGPVVRLSEGTFGDLSVAGDGKLVVTTSVSLTHPPEIVRIAAAGAAPTRLTTANDAALHPFALRPGESVTYTGAAGKQVQAWIVRPPDFDPAKKYPLLVLIHGGPQGVWNDGWTFRWNAQIFASAGYVVFAPNPRGSVGWGQEFVDEVNRDWGGRAYEDVMRGTDFAEALPYVAKGRTVAAGASYGGYLVNWIAGHTDRFKALVSHDGIFDLRSMYGSTEELWFVDWEFGGPFWKNPEHYDRWSPSNHVARFKTPTLVVHGEQDHRVPLEQGLAMFTALQRQGVPSRLLVFPDENHWVLKPANSVRWYQEVLDWLNRWSKP